MLSSRVRKIGKPENNKLFLIQYLYLRDSIFPKLHIVGKVLCSFASYFPFGKIAEHNRALDKTLFN